MIQEKICGIYRLISPSNKNYIGQSEDIYSRWNDYRLLRCVAQRRLYNSIKKHGWDAHKREIVHQIPIYNREELNQLEAHYGELFQTPGENGLNLKKCGGSKGKHSEESNKKNSESCKLLYKLGKKVVWNKNKKECFTEETTKKMSKSHLGKKHTEAQIEKIRQAHIRIGAPALAKWCKENENPFKGKKHTEEAKKKNRDAHIGVSPPNKGGHLTDAQKLHLRNINLGKKPSEESIVKMSKLIINLETGIYYIGLQQAADSIGMNKNTLIGKLNGSKPNNTPFINA